jgi:leader peptidase (prepilin peptidase)/N-methyltransferase
VAVVAAPPRSTLARVAAIASLAALADVALALRLGWTPALPAYLFLGVICAVVSVTDVSSRRIPNRVVLPAYAIGGCLLAAASASDDEWSALLRAALGMAVLGGFYLLLALAFSGQMGFGDVKLAGLLGLFLGFLGWPAVTTGALLASLLSALGAACRHGLGGGSGRATIAFGSYLCLGTLLAVLLVP